jgi:plasmid maintenance system antidote protein VapI
MGVTPKVRQWSRTARERFTAWCDEEGVRQVARLLEVDHAHVSRVKKGKKGVSGALAAKIQELRGIPSIDWFR